MASNNNEDRKVNAKLEDGLAGQARALPISKREEILRSFPETELHDYLRLLFQKFNSAYEVEVTHGPQECGKDLVIVKSDRFGAHVIGVVVKCGNLKGKTAGDVDKIINGVEAVSKENNIDEDGEIEEVAARVTTACTEGVTRKLSEIKSQIRQAAANLAELKSVFIKLKVNEVYVVIAGEIGRSARKRLENELPPVRVYDLSWLVDNFTDLYPQVFFEGRAQDFIQAEINRLQHTPWMNRAGVNLTDYYVEPTFMSCDMPIELDHEHLSGLAKLGRLPFHDLPGIMAQKGYVLILGDPGSGKSAALAKLALDKLQLASLQLRKSRRENTDIPVPVLLTARELLALQDLDTLVAVHASDCNLPSGLRIDCLLVDALDELPQDQRLPALTRAREAAEKYRCPLVVSSRRVGDIQAVSNGNYVRYEILPFQAGQALELFKHLASGTMLQSLTDGLRRVEFQIPLFPLSLMLLIRLVDQHQEVPASVTELYSRFLEIALGKEDQDKGIQVLFEYRIKWGFLARLAYVEFFEKDRIVIPREDFNSFTGAYCDEFGYNASKLQEFLMELERAGILDLRDEVEFKHRSFLDYFVASHVFDDRENIPNLMDKIVELYYSSFWGDVAFFYIGLKTELSAALLGKLLEHQSAGMSDLVDKMMIGRLLQAGWKSSAIIKSQGIDGALDAAEPLRKSFLDFCRSHNPSFPGLYVDFIMLGLTDASFNSSFLNQQLTRLFTTTLSEQGVDGLPKAILILWAQQRLLTSDELRDAVERCSKLLSGVLSITPEQEARFLLLLKLVSSKDKELDQAIAKKLRKLASDYPDTMKKLLPMKQRQRRLPR